MQVLNTPPLSGPSSATPAPVTPVKAPRERDNLKNILSTVAILLIAPLVAVLLTAFVFQSYQVDGPSMEKTLYNNDRLIVWKFPKTWARITGGHYIPNRGDVIVFTEPKLAEFGQDPGKQLIKRIVALPGERVVINKNIVMVYNDDHPDGFQPDIELPYHRVGTDTSGDIDTVIGEDEVFVLGDNRPNSLDSRAFGPVHSDDIVGKLIVRVLPISEMKRF
jgi:signal peptidase I